MVNTIHMQPKTILSLFSVFLVLFGMPGGSAQAQQSIAITDNQRRFYDLGLGYYADIPCPPGSNSATQSPSSNMTSTISGGDNEEKVFNFLSSNGLSDVQVAGIMGNLIWESGGLNVTATNPISGAYGIAQWYAGRKDALWALPNYDTLEVQLDFLWGELTDSYYGPRVLEPILATDQLATVTRIWLEKFEIPCPPGSAACDSEMNIRLPIAERILNQYGTGNTGSTLVGYNTAGTTPMPSTTATLGVVDNGFCGPSTPNGGVTATAAASQFIDGMLIYSQTDPAWKDEKFGTSTIGAAGCGITAMATIITALTGNSVTPDDVVKSPGAQALYEENLGSSWSLPKVISNNYNLTATKISATATDITNILNQGGLVITSGKGDLPFSETYGHYIVIRAVTSDGKWMIADSSHAGSETNTTAYDPEYILSIIITSEREPSMYGITP